MPFKTIDEYIKAAPEEARIKLEKIRCTIQSAAPKATETFAYGVPAFDLDGQHLVLFAAFKKHIGIYPTPAAIVAFKKELKPYKTSEGAIQFPLDEPIPLGLIKKMTAFKVKEVIALNKTKPTKTKRT